MENKVIKYTLTRETTSKQTGFFVAAPDDEMTLEEALGQLTLRPQDAFMRQHVLRLIGKMPPEEMREFLDKCEEDENPVKRGLAVEYLLLSKGRDHLTKHFKVDEIRELNRHTPLIYMRSFLEPDQVLHNRWTEIFRANMYRHEPLPAPGKTGLPSLVFKEAPPQSDMTLAALAESFPKGEKEASAEIPPGQTAEIAAKRLEKAGVSLGGLMRHESSLSPIGLLRSWNFNTMVENRRNRFLLSGEQTSYGRGLTLDAAKASLMMEIVERCSSFASVSEKGLENYQSDYPIRRAAYSELLKNETEGVEAVNPSGLALEVSYRDQPLNWVLGETPNSGRDKGSRPVWVPAQSLFLFSNLDEPDLFSGLGSTGLASGNTPAQAKVSALLEIVERHQAATVPYDLSSCFQLVAQDGKIAGLLDAYQKAGIHYWFQDITPPSGIPCCRCFVMEETGEVHMGAAAHLDARRAIVSAITETTCPFPKAPPTRPAPQDIIMVSFENLPDYSTNNYETDVALLESIFIQTNHRPCYVDLTRADIGLPVVKAIAPGMEVLGDFDNYSRVHPDLYRNYFSLFKPDSK